MSYYNKYNKYKTKYLELKKCQTGGKNKENIIIHISGPSGSGKTTLGNKLKEKFGKKIVVKDIDNLRREFIKKHYNNKKWSKIDKESYQQYINDYVVTQTKPIIFVGLNHMPWWHKNHYYNMHSNYNYYIEIDDDTLIKQKCLRLFEDMQTFDKMAMDDLINNNKKFVKLTKDAIERDCGKKEITKMNKKWNKDYKKQKYKFMTHENIFRNVSKLLYKSLKK